LIDCTAACQAPGPSLRSHHRGLAGGDDRALDEAWIDKIVDLGSQRGQYQCVTSIGFAA
jgi:hypothetical protein